MGRDAGLRRQGKCCEEHDECDQMDCTSLDSDPFMVWG